MLAVPVATGLTKPVVLVVATLVLLDIHVATAVMSCVLLHVVANALNCIVPPPLSEIAPGFVGVIAIDEIQPTVTVAVAVVVRPCVSAVIVVVVRDWPFGTKVFGSIVTTPVGFVDQFTPEVIW